MPNPSLSIVERHNVDTGSWFAKLSPSMRQAILDCAQVRRLHDGDRLTTRGATAQEWCGVAEAEGEEIRIGLALAQEDMAQMLGASRQRVNQELKGFERNGALRVEPTRWVVLSRGKLLALSEHV